MRISDWSSDVCSSDLRVEDIPALATHFLAASARSLGVPVKRLTPDAVAVLTRFDFPGNVRQLENFCHWLTVMAPGDRKSVVQGTSVSVRVDLGGSRLIKKKKKYVRKATKEANK